jgi:hypothetical protein
LATFFSSQGLGIRSKFSVVDLLVPDKRWAGPDKSGNHKNLEVKRDSLELHYKISGAGIYFPKERGGI